MDFISFATYTTSKEGGSMREFTVEEKRKHLETSFKKQMEERKRTGKQWADKAMISRKQYEYYFSEAGRDELDRPS